MTETTEKTNSKFEKVLFKFTRYFALSGAICALIGGIFLLLNLFGSDDKNDYVSLYDLRPSQQTQEEGSKYVSNHPTIKLPDNVKKYLSGENEKILYGWIEPLEKSNKKNFIENLSLVIAEAEKNNENVVEIINEYKTVKLEKLSGSGFEKYERKVNKGVMLGTIFGLFIFIALMSLVLVMLAIERNTSKAVYN